MTSEKLKVIAYLYRNERSKSEYSSGSSPSKTPEVESQRYAMAFLMLGKHLIVDSGSALADVFRILKGSTFNNDNRCLGLPASQYSR